MRENYYSKIVLCFKGSHQNKNPCGGLADVACEEGVPLPAGGLGLANVTHGGGRPFLGGTMFPAGGGQRCPRGTLFNPSLNNSNVSGVHKIIHVLYLVKGEVSGKNRVV